ncbi:GNAT family N-acetyltransferase [Streptomyces sp. R41]|uniref:GNAT family N-acetyltransferase n=1 Tax=Streptomyces sp. R41 TaxID=3238632 RepID=A0AB39R3B3_9ACTN
MARSGPGQAQKVEGYEPSAGGEIYLRGLSRWQAEDQREDLADLYVESADTAAGEEYHNREGFLGRLTDDVGKPGFDMMVAEATVAAETAVLVGCVFGFPVRRDGDWWHGFVGALPQNIEQLTASGHVFAITEIVVHPHERNRGLARHLQERLLADHQASLGVTLVSQTDHVTYDAFLSWGWQDVGELNRPPSLPILRALVLPLGERTEATPDGLAHNASTERPGEADGVDPGMR